MKRERKCKAISSNIFHLTLKQYVNKAADIAEIPRLPIIMQYYNISTEGIKIVVAKKIRQNNPPVCARWTILSHCGGKIILVT
jgi:hypothetical protein